MKLLLQLIGFVFISFSSMAQEFDTELYFENGAIKTTKQQLDKKQTEQIHYFPDGAIRSKGIIKNDIYTSFEAFDEDGTVLATIQMTNTLDEELYSIKKFHTNGKPLQHLTYIKDTNLVHTYLPTGVWTSYNSNGQLIEEVTYNPKLKQVDCFSTGTSYYNTGQKKVTLSFNYKTRRLTFEQFYPNGKTYLKAIFDYYILLGNYDDYVEKSKLLNLLRSPSLINNYFYKKENAITFFKYSYPNGQTAFFKKEDLEKRYTLDGTILNSKDGYYSPNLEGFTKCTSTSKQKACQAFYAETSQDRLNYIPKQGRYIVMADQLTKFTRVYDFSETQNGTITHYGFNKTPLQVMTYQSGQLHGLYKDIHEISGEVTLEGQYANGNKDGEFKTYSTFGELEFKENYTDGLKDGLYQYNGTVGDYWTTTFTSDIKNGEATLRSTFTDEILLLGACKNDLKDGRWKKYSLDFERYYPNSVLDYGIDFDFFENGKLINELSYY
ncbi:hypothetical protein [Olleya sp. YS]|uniref:toxin-antitoxin system YwqK family antitoxin n=1 Tax=Olleya sp. YS TaxID=3028318 RepID=UPI002434512F|nr:hypothetical protein [Olleya sp. YS]WGD34522.1 hypothetical protein Ollyesu_12125 [Olleya sp. YS]